MQKFSIKTYIFIFLVALFWASAFVGIRVGLKSYSPDALALLRYLVASVVMIPLYLKSRSVSKSLTQNEIIRIILIGIIGIGIYNIALNYGEITVSSAIASFVVSQVPVFIVLFAIVFLKERVNYIGWFGILISTSGIVLITISKWGGAQFSWGIVYILLAAIAGAIYSILQKPLLRKVNGMELAALAIWSGTAAMLIFLPKLITELPHALTISTFAAVYMGIFPGAVAYAAWSLILTHMPASRAAGYLYVIPILTILLGWLLLNEIPLLLSLSGGIVALLGAVILHCSRKIG